MSVFGSIRWRLQLWHGALLAVVLLGFGAAIWHLQLSTEYQRIDQELEQRVAAVNAILRSRDELPPSRPQLRAPDGQRRRGPGRGGIDGEYYYVAWAADGRELVRSATAPENVPAPERADSQRTQRLRGTAREFVFVTGQGDTILVGRDIDPELAAIRRQTWLIIGAGAAIFILGLAGGWWGSTRALSPIAVISAAAGRISTGNLAQRIPSPGAGSELAALTAVLNDTFARLQEGYVRQARWTADASHELRTPVSVVLTETQAALARERSAGEYRASLQVCERTAQRMSRLIDSLLALARLDRDTPTAHAPCELDRVAGDTVAWLRPLAERHGVTLLAEGEPAPCLGDPVQLGQVAANLIDNAITYSGTGAVVRVVTARDGAEVSLTVSDTGPGIGAEDLPHIFERFYRADPARAASGGRTGLGLAIAKAIVDAHRGAITATSAPGAGTVVRVTLPARPPAATPA